LRLDRAGQEPPSRVAAKRDNRLKAHGFDRAMESSRSSVASNPRKDLSA
jgi:hypothetical protein